MTKAIDITKPLQLADGRKANFRRIAIGHPDCILVDVLGAIGGKMFYQETGKAYFGQLPDLQNVPEVAPKIDWTKPIEYVDGTPAFVSTEQRYAKPQGLVAVSIRGSKTPDGSGNWYTSTGAHHAERHMAIRNVAEVAPALDFTKPLTTRDGQQVRILTTTDGSSEYPIVGFIGDETIPSGWTAEGRAWVDGTGEEEDLVNVEPIAEPDVAHASIYRCGTVNKWDGLSAGMFPSDEGRATVKITFPKDGKPTVEVL